MTPLEIFDYKRNWEDGCSVPYHSDHEDKGKQWCKEHLEPQQHHIQKFTDVYEHTFMFEHRDDLKRFVIFMGESIDGICKFCGEYLEQARTVYEDGSTDYYCCENEECEKKQIVEDEQYDKEQKDKPTYDELEAERDLLEKGIQQVIDDHSPATAIIIQVKLRMFREGKL